MWKLQVQYWSTSVLDIKYVALFMFIVYHIVYATGYVGLRSYYVVDFLYSNMLSSLYLTDTDNVFILHQEIRGNQRNTVIMSCNVISNAGLLSVQDAFYLFLVPRAGHKLEKYICRNFFWYKLFVSCQCIQLTQVCLICRKKFLFFRVGWRKNNLKYYITPWIMSSWLKHE